MGCKMIRNAYDCIGWYVLIRHPNWWYMVCPFYVAVPITSPAGLQSIVTALTYGNFRQSTYHIPFYTITRLGR